MISGFNSSSISLALRTAQRAEKTVSKTVEQIATGKKVASVKDDGAAFARIMMFNSQKAEIEARNQTSTILRAASEQQISQMETVIEYLGQLKQLVISAKQYAQGSAQRTAIQSEFKEAMNQMTMPMGDGWMLSNTSYGNWGAAGWGIQPHLSDPVLGSNAIWYHPGIGAYTASLTVNGILAKDNDLTNADSTYLDNILTWANSRIASTRDSYLMWNVQDLKFLDQVNSWDEKSKDNIDKSISSLSDADMGKVSRDRDLAQSRQELAFQTVQNAISHYSNVSSGLLNNVMGTQRSIRA